MNKKPYILIFAISLVFYVGTALAQFDLPNIGNIKPAIILNSDPLTPLPNSTVTITASLSGVTGAGDSNYAWFLNGIRQTGASGLNKNTFAFRVGATGAIYKINANVTTPNGENLFDSISLTVSDVDLTWVANSKTPVFYRAKIMPTQNSFVTISALPFIYRPGTKSRISANSLIYNWTIDRKLDSLKSGMAENSYILKVNNFFGNPYSVRLEVKTADSAISLNKFITIPVVRPQVWLYFSDPSTGLPFGAALKNLTIKPANFNFVAETYFFTAPKEELRWRWFINNREIMEENEKPWLASLNLANDFLGQFSAQIKVAVQNPQNDLEIAESITNLEIK